MCVCKINVIDICLGFLAGFCLVVRGECFFVMLIIWSSAAGPVCQASGRQGRGLGQCGPASGPVHPSLGSAPLPHHTLTL